MDEINQAVRIDEKEVQIDFVQSSGPGGQNVNKVATAVQLRFDVAHSTSLDPQVKDRLIHLAGKRLTGGGILIIEAKRYRTQERNRLDAIGRLEKLIEKALTKPITRIKTKPSSASQIKRLTQKKQKGQLKRNRNINQDAWG